MNGLEKVDLIKKNKLSKRFYFRTLLEEGYRVGLLDETDVQKIQLSSLELLAQKAHLYTGGESSSVRVEVAEGLMMSNFYTLGLALKPLDPEEAIAVIKKGNLRAIYQEGREGLDARLKTAKQDHQLVKKNNLALANITYGLTLNEGMDSFFKKYSPDYSAHEIHITLDYPLCNPRNDLAGIELIQHYLVSLYFENQFCQYFSPEALEQLFLSYHKDYKELILNIFEQVLTTALGCVLARVNVLDLSLGGQELAYLQQGLARQSPAQVTNSLARAYEQLTKQLPIKSPLLQKYIEAALPKISANIRGALVINALDKVFVETKYPVQKPEIKVFWGAKMPDEAYRKFNQELIQCRFARDQLTMIKSQVRSLADLEDIFLDGALDSEAITQVLQDMEVVEIAAFAKRYPYEPERESRDLDDPYLVFSQTLNHHIHTLTPDQQKWLTGAIDCLIWADE